MTGEALSDIGETVAVADISRRDARPKGDDRHVLAGMVASGPARIAAVIGGDEREIAGSQQSFERGQPAIEILQRACIAGNVAPVAVQHVEINEIDQNQRVVWRGRGFGEERIEQRGVAVRLDLASGSHMGVDIPHLADGDHRTARRLVQREQGRRGRRHGEVLAVAGAAKVLGARSDKRAGDDAADIVGLHKRAGDAGATGCNPADLAEPFDVLDLNDITEMINQKLAGTLDLNGDGLCDLGDINVFVTQFLAACP